eukprot:PhF_6_TR40380/c1_g5_i1/m.60134
MRSRRAVVGKGNHFEIYYPTDCMHGHSQLQSERTYGRMLRFALGLPPAFLSRTFTLLGHTLREQIKGSRTHQYATILLSEWSVSEKAQCFAHHVCAKLSSFNNWPRAEK